MEKLRRSGDLVEDVSEDLASDWGKLGEEQSKPSVTWEDLANNEMTEANDESPQHGESLQHDDFSQHDDDIRRDDLPQHDGAPQYDETLYSSESEYLAAQRAAAAIEETEDELPVMTARQLNRQLFSEARGGQNRTERTQEVAGATMPEETTSEDIVLEENAEVAHLSKEVDREPEEVEIPGEEWFGSVIGMLDTTLPLSEQLGEMVRGSRIGEEMSGVLITCIRDMIEKSAAQLATLRSERNLGNFELISEVYNQQMRERYQYSAHALDVIRTSMKDKPLPRELMGGIIASVQQIENNLGGVNGLVTRNPQTRVAMEKLASDEAELKQIYNVE